MKLNTIIRLRRDNDYNYAKIKDTFIPANGEICLVDTARDGLRAVCGDGQSTFGQLNFMGEIIVKGYYKDNNFYSDKDYNVLLSASITKIYIDISTSTMYYYDGLNYIAISNADVHTATAEIPGVMKLYDTIGYNTDGTMTQRAITDELDDKVEVMINASEEMVIFTN